MKMTACVTLGFVTLGFCGAAAAAPTTFRTAQTPHDAPSEWRSPIVL